MPSTKLFFRTHIEEMDSFLGISLPIENPIAIFLMVLLIVLLAPILLKRLHIPHIVGMILAGLLLGPYALNILPFDRSIDVFGKVGLYYIMFLAGMEIDIADLRLNRGKSIVFGLTSSLIPALSGFALSHWILHYSVATSVLISSMFASHTLVSFPIISRYGLAKRRAVNIAVGGTVVAVTLSMILLAVIDCRFSEGSQGVLWMGMIVKMIVALAVIFLAVPRLSHWFLKYNKDGVLRFVFVLAMAFFGALLTELAGFQGILGAFFTGLALNREVPKLSSLMNRVEFVGNALFFPYFLISIGMMIDLRVFFHGPQALLIALLMTVIVLVSKWLAAQSMRPVYKMSGGEADVLFGLSSGRAAVTLAVVMIGYNIILGYSDNGQPVRLLNDYILNGSVVMILISCLVSSFVTERGAKSLLLDRTDEEQAGEAVQSRILIPVSNPRIIENLLQIVLFSRMNQEDIYALSVVDESESGNKKEARNLLDMTAQYAASVELDMHQIMRYDTDIPRGIALTAREYDISDVMIALHRKVHLQDRPVKERLSAIVDQVRCNLYINHIDTPPASIRRLVLIIPERAEYEQGFHSFIKRAFSYAGNLVELPEIYAHPTTIVHLRDVIRKSTNKAIVLNEWYNWDNIPLLLDNLAEDTLPVLMISRKGGVSYQPYFVEIPNMLENFNNRSWTVYFPEQPRFIQNITSYSGPLNLVDSSSVNAEDVMI